LTGTLIISNSVKTVGEYAFYNCSGLTGTLTIPPSVKTVGKYAFYNCSGLTGVTVPQSVTAIGEDAFSGCSALTEINVNARNPNYSSADGVVFNKDTTELIIYPSGKTGNYTIPHSVTAIGDYAFYRCSGLTGTLTIPHSVKTVGEWAFSGCSGLTGLIIGHSAETFGGHAFYNCSKLSTVTNQRSTPQRIKSTVFEKTDISSSGMLRVPAGSVNTYRVANGWKEFKNIVEINE
jgi:hypothetical protein